MYRLTPRMLQNLKDDLRKYHDLLKGGRCSGWEMEELIVRAIKSDTKAQHYVRWKEGGHDDEADIFVQADDSDYPIQVKSGQWKSQRLILSGHRLGRFRDDFHKITDYLNNPRANTLAVPCIQADDDQGRTFTYQVCYIDMQYLVGLNADEWDVVGQQYRQTNAHGVEFSIRPSMSWQIWWSIPEEKVDIGLEFPVS